MHGLDTSNVSGRVESSQVEFEPKIDELKARNSHGRLCEWTRVKPKCHQQIAGQVFQCVCAKSQSQCVMAQLVEVDIGQAVFIYRVFFRTTL